MKRGRKLLNFKLYSLAWVLRSFNGKRDVVWHCGEEVLSVEQPLCIHTSFMCSRYSKKAGTIGVIAGAITLAISLFIAVRVQSVRFRFLKNWQGLISSRSY
jgi:hypothetical protein